MSTIMSPYEPSGFSRPRSVSTTAPRRARSRCRLSESWLPETNTNGSPRRVTRLTSLASSGDPRSVRSPAKNSGPSPVALLEDRLGEEVVVEVGRDRDRRPVGQRGEVGRVGDQAGEADELRVELLVERARGALGGLDRVERARDVGAERVVLRLVDVPARGEQDHERDPDRDGGHDGRGDRVAESRSGSVADREGDEQADYERAHEREADQLAQVGRDRVAGLGADVLQVEHAALRDPAHRVAVDGAEVDVEAHRRADRVLEQHAPVDERDVEVERAGLAGVGRQLDPADAQLALLVVGVERGVGAGERGDDHGGDDQRMADDQEELAAVDAARSRWSRKARPSLQNASWSHGMVVGLKGSNLNRSRPLRG